MTLPNRALRVLFVSHGGGLHGAQRTLLDLVTGMDRERVVPLLATKPGDPMALGCPEDVRIVDPGALNHWAPTWAHVQPHNRARYALGAARGCYRGVSRFRQTIRKHAIDLVYTNTVTVIEGALAASLEKVPHVWHIHEPIRRNNEMAPLMPWLAYRAIIGQLADRVILPSRSLLTEYDFGNERVEVIYSGTPIPPIPDRALKRETLRSVLEFESDAELVATVGALHPRKDHATFLRMAASLHRTNPKARFIVCGRGDAERFSQLEQLAESLGIRQQVKFVGNWTDSIYNLLAGIDVLVVSSQQESFGLTAVEALTMQTPVVSTRCGGPEETILHGRTGLLVDIGDEDGMAAAVAELLVHRDRARSMGVAGRIDVEQRFGLDQCITSIQRAILRTAEQHLQARP